MNGKNLKQKLTQIGVLVDECLRELGNDRIQIDAGRTAPKILTKSSGNVEPDFTLNSRAFFKKYAKGLSGPKKFVLTIAYIVKGELVVNVTTDQVKKIWNDHQSLFGGKLTTGVYGTRAKESGWIDPVGNNLYHLNSTWKEIFN